MAEKKGLPGCVQKKWILIVCVILFVCTSFSVAALSTHTIQGQKIGTYTLVNETGHSLQASKPITYEIPESSTVVNTYNTEPPYSMQPSKDVSYEIPVSSMDSDSACPDTDCINELTQRITDLESKLKTAQEEIVELQSIVETLKN